MKIFGEWLVGRRNKKACDEESQFAMETSQIQDLETNICDVTAESKFLADEFDHGSMQKTQEKLTLHECFTVFVVVFSAI